MRSDYSRTFVFLILTAVLLAGDPATSRATTAPVAAYGFEDTGASTFAGDSSAFGNTGVVEGPARVSGRAGSALSFDGVNDQVRVADAPSLDLATGMTLEAWVKPTATNGWRTAIMKERGNDLSYGLYGSGADRPSGYVWTAGGPGTTAAPSALALNTWTHIALSYNGATLRLYANGVQVASAARSGSLIASDGTLAIGGNGVWGEWFAGVIDEVRIYDRALTAAEIQTDMTVPVGDPVAPGPDRGPDRIGSWTPPTNWPLVAVHASMLSNGKVAMWDAFAAAPGSERIWDPESGLFEPAPSGINLFCSGHALLPDGRLFVAGGHQAGYLGLPDIRLLSPLTRSWTAGPDMSRGRWYPTTTSLPDGRILIVSGDNITVGGPYTPFYASSDTLPEIYNPKTNTVSALPSAARPMPLYPFMFVTPDGRVVDAGPDTTTRILNPETGQWTTLASRSPIDGHSAVMYRPGKILKTGTWTETEFQGVPVHGRSAILELNQTTPSWRETAPMKRARTFHTLTVLPGGDVLALGGQSASGADSLPNSPVLEPEIWDPASDTWTSMAQSIRPRGYHNTSLLLPDGRILLAGSGRLDGSMMVNEQTAEIFSPPYLHKGPRPVITSAPGRMDYGGSIDVDTPDAARIAKVSLVRTGSVTHSFNMDQRWQELNFRQVAGGLEIDAPTSANDAPPGVYYVFVIDDKGVPSKAAIVSIANAAAAPDTVAPSVPGGVSASGAVSRVSLSWTASTDNVGVARYVVHRSSVSGFSPSAATRVATVSSQTSFDDTGLAAGSYFYRVIAEDQAGNASAPSAEASGASLADTTAPVVSLTAPAAGSTQRGTVTVSASASDAVGVAGVQFRLDGADLGAEDTSAPYSASWNTTTATAGAHTLSAIARDAAGNRTTAANVTVTVDNSAPAGPSPLAAYAFENGSGTTVTDTTGNGNTGTIREATWTTTGRNGRALRFDGVNDWVTVNDTPALRLSSNLTLEAWVNPTTTTGWRTAILKETTSDLAYALYSSGSARPSAHLTTTTGAGSATAPTAAPINTWTHLAATYDAITIRLYLNGTQVATAPRTSPLTTSTNPLRLGGNNIWGEWFAGQLDDIRIYDKTLTPTQIQTDMTTPAGQPAAPDTTAPVVSLTAPAAGSTQRGTVTVSASASDAVGVAGVQFRLDGADLGAEDTSAPYSASWNTTTATAGAHTLSAIARDAAGNRTTAANVTVTVDNSAPAGPSPLAAYAFENGSGTTVTDTTGNGNTGTIREATWTTTGRNGRALRFDGVNDWVTVNDTPALRLSSNLTLEAWVNPTTTTGWRTAILKETTSDLAYALYSSGSARPSAHLTTTTGAGSATAPTAAPINTWTHLAATYDAITIRLYLNGTQVATAPRTSPLTTSTNPLRLGGNNIWGEWFAGQLDDIRIYDKTLTPTQIQTDMTTPAG